MKNFANKIIVITGAGSGMGRAYALEFARLGAHDAERRQRSGGTGSRQRGVEQAAGAGL